MTTDDLAKTAPVYSSRYRAKQRLYRRKVKPAKVDNPMALPSVTSALVVKAVLRKSPCKPSRDDRDGDCREHEKRDQKRKKIPPTPGFGLVTAGQLGRPKSEPAKKPTYDPNDPDFRTAMLGEFEVGYNPGSVRNGRLRPGKVVKAMVHYVENGQKRGKPRPVVLIGPLKDGSGHYAAVALTSKNPENFGRARNHTHVAVPELMGLLDRDSYANVTKFIVVRPDQMITEHHPISSKGYDRLYRLTRESLLRGPGSGGSRPNRDDLRKAILGGLGAKLGRGGASIAAAMTATERSARTKEGWKRRKRAAPELKVDRQMMRQRLGETVRTAASRTKLGQAVAEAKDEKRQRQQQRDERRQAIRDLITYVRTGDDSIVDRWIPQETKDAMEAMERGGQPEVSEKDRQRAEQQRLRDEKRQQTEDARRRAKSQALQRKYRSERERLKAKKERETAAAAKTKEREAAKAERDKAADIRNRERQVNLAERQERLAAREAALAEREAARAAKEAERRAAEEAKRREARNARRRELRAQRKAAA